MDSYHIGIDLGGTKIEGVVLDGGFADAGVDPSRHLLERRRIPTGGEQGYEAILERIASFVEELGREVPTQPQAPSLGIGLPGHITRRAGVVKNSNTTCLNGRNLWGDLQQRLSRTIAFANDANCFTLAEATWGSGRGAESVFGVILGTGVGGGIVLGGELRGGGQGIAGEWGYTILHTGGRRCYCEKQGCVETYLCGPGLERTLKEQAGIELSAREFNDRLAGGEFEGQAGVEEALASYLRDFGQALGNVINVLDPEVVVLGGGMSHFQPLYSTGVEQVSRFVFNDELLTSIVEARLGDSAGVYGAALLGALADQG